MFTSRAEYRLLLRQDNADMRLSQIGHDLGLLPERNYRRFAAKRDAVSRELTRLAASRADAMLRRPEVSYLDLPGQDASLPPDVIQQVEIEIKYAGYIDRQELEIEKFRALEDKAIPDWLDYASVPSLRTEARAKLGKIRPATLGQASRISGVSPSDLAILTVWIKRGRQSVNS
jgi:tRNA uridine 5-carboxymethylaminomethyl modification enzyme